MGTGKWVRCSNRDPDDSKRYVCLYGKIEKYYYWDKQDRGWYAHTGEHVSTPDYWLDPPDLPEPEIKLLPCPNPECGESHHLVWANNSASFWALCQRCGMKGPKKGDRDAAYQAWNNLPR